MTHAARPLPRAYVQRYRGWFATQFEENKAWYARLAGEGQHPRAMVISCCDSRVQISSIFGADSGEFFIHRNIANLVPPYKPDGDLHGTSATIEYAVGALKVSHIFVLGHSQCGGVKGCHDMCAGKAPELEEKTSFVGRWMDLLRGGYENVKGIKDEDERLTALEKQGVLTSIDNLMTFPQVAAEVEAGNLSLHALWQDIGKGQLQCYDDASGAFQPV
ncbi:carbonic anhydrase [Algicella marina]|uniref:Carbonic anhydrase n=1 Tax=Algicella marina TaxID=2683284 RepID=A0A6P1T4P5_9RHOB|nr:carbonic anhydrase [Algicella marina]QHQ36715.1 carbonic anhydrase [Algicella marina]